jgi:RNA polymerase sigma-70 factor (ECF subfamily)
MTWESIDLHWAYGDLLRSINRQTGNRDHAYDVLHEALLRMAMRGNTGPAPTQPNAYLRVIVQNVLLDSRRNGARWLPYPDCDPDHSRPEHPDLVAARKALPAGSNEALTSPEHIAEVRRRLAALQRVMACLPVRRREVFWLHRVEGYTQAEIATKLGISLKIVERHVMRALMDIARHLRP